MELEEAVKFLNEITDEHTIKIGNISLSQAIETILEELKNSIPKKKIEDKIKTFGEENEVITQEEYYARSYIRKFLKELLEEK